MEHRARLQSIRPPKEDFKNTRQQHQLLLEAVSYALQMWETDDLLEREELYQQSRTKLHELQATLGPRRPPGPTRFRATNLGAFLFGDPNK
jgi:hypothetical protein